MDYRYYKVGSRWYEIPDGPQGGVEVPFLRLSGRWLEEAGFHIGQRIEVEVGDGELRIIAWDTPHIGRLTPDFPGKKVTDVPVSPIYRQKDHRISYQLPLF